MTIMGDNTAEDAEITEVVDVEIIAIPMIVKVILTEVDDGIIIVEVKDTVIVGEVDDGTPISSIMTQGTNRSLNFKTQITTDHPRWDINIDTQSHMVNTHTSPSNHSTCHKCQPPLNKPLIFVNCATVKAIMITNANLQAILRHAHKKTFNQGRSYSHQDPNNGEWSQGDGDNNDPNGQPFQ